MRVEACSVNWLTTSARPPASASERFINPPSSGKTRIRATFPASHCASSTPSPCSTPNNTSSPRPISPTASPPTRTLASLTRCTTARTTPRSPPHGHVSSGNSHPDALARGAGLAAGPEKKPPAAMRAAGGD